MNPLDKMNELSKRDAKTAEIVFCASQYHNMLYIFGRLIETTKTTEEQRAILIHGFSMLINQLIARFGITLPEFNAVLKELGMPELDIVQTESGETLQ